MPKIRTISVEAEMPIPREAVRRPVTHRDCNNIPTSARPQQWVKMYADLTRKNKRKKLRIKSLSDNKVEYSWKQIYANISISRLDELKNSGDSQILSLVKSKVQIAEKTLADSLGTGLYNAGTDSKAIGGLRHIVHTTSTVGGISQSSYSWWQGVVDAGTTTTLTLAALQTKYSLASIDNDKPSVIMAARGVYDNYFGLLQPQQRFQDSGTASGGFSSILFNGTPLISDSHCPASHLFMINEKYLHLFVHKDEDFRFEPFQRPVNQAVKVAKIFWTGALGSSNNRMHVKFTGLAA